MRAEDKFLSALEELCTEQKITYLFANIRQHMTALDVRRINIDFESHFFDVELEFIISTRRDIDASAVDVTIVKAGELPRATSRDHRR